MIEILGNTNSLLTAIFMVQVGIFLALGIIVTEFKRLNENKS